MPIRDSHTSPQQYRRFVTTRWSLILRAGDDSDESKQALEQLCQLYWYPIFTFARFNGHTREEAEDLTQGFFAQLLERQSLRNISRAGGRFRSFLLVAFKNFVANQAARQRAQKRGQGRIHLSLEEPECAGQIESSVTGEVAPDRLFDRAWALVLIDRVHATLRGDYEKTGRLDLYQKLVQFLPGESSSETQAEAARSLGMRDSAFRMKLSRFKQRLAECIRSEVAETVGPAGEVDAEVRYLMEAFDR